MKTAEDIIRQKGGEIVKVDQNATIYDALLLMTSKKVGVVVITRDGAPIGIWSSRDLMHNTLMKGFDPQTSRISDFMVTSLKSAPHTDTAFNLMDKFLGLRVNHLLIEKNKKYIFLY